MILGEEEIGEPELTYWQPTPKTAMGAAPFPVINHSYNYTRPFCNPHTLSPSNYHSPPNLLPAFFTTSVHPYTYNQPQLYLGYEGERRRMPQSSQISSEILLNALSSSNSVQDGQTVTDNLIKDEVTRAAKILFSKRNRTLMHWLKPNISKNQLKIDVDATWECLPKSEQMFYISQVWGKFSPYTTSLMVNPQLEPTNKESLGCMVTNMDDKTTTSGNSVCPTDMVRTRRTRSESMVGRGATGGKSERKPQKRKVKRSSEDETSCDSGTVMDSGGTEETAGQIKVKRKYNRKKYKIKIKEEKLEEEYSSSCSSLPVKISDIKKEINEEPEEPIVPRIKRKYIKRKLVRKKYKKRETKSKMVNESPQVAVSSTTEPGQTVEDMDVWIDLVKDEDLNKEIEGIGLLEDEVDRFWDNIDDPNNLFLELEIE